MTAKALEKKLEYRFHNADLLRQALTHPSMGKDDNQRLEFLGDAVLQLTISDMIYAAHPQAQEGEMTHLRQLLVCETALSEVAQKLGVGEALMMDHGEEITGGRTKPSVLCDAMEAVLAAVYLDGGMDPVRRIVQTWWPKPENVKMPLQDSKGRLQELLQKNGGSTPVYSILSQEGPSNDCIFTAAVSYDGRTIGTGKGRSKRQAEKAAALNALKDLEESDQRGTNPSNICSS